MLEANAITPIAAFAAGVVSVLSPCVLPLLPVVLAYSTGESKFRPLAVIAGLIASFTFMGIAASAFADILIPHTYELRILAEIIITVSGLSMLSDRDVFAFLSQFTGKFYREGKGIFGGLLVGISLGIVWIPCVGAILASILTLVALENDIMYGASLLMIYSLGFAVPMLLIAYSAKLSGDRIKKLSQYDVEIKKLAGAVLVLMGLWMIYNNHIIYLF